jgi:hypothetical protein
MDVFEAGYCIRLGRETIPTPWPTIAGDDASSGRTANVVVEA